MKYVLTIFLLCVVKQCWSYPIHASCTIQWKFGITCNEVKTKIVNQFGTWTGPDGCKSGGEKCLYKLSGSTGMKITGTHTTPVKHYVDDLTFTLTSVGNTSCDMEGHSTSETWYAVLDKGTNYCNLHNLITGSGLDKVAGYSESTSDSVCTQYSSADCDTY